MADRAQRGDGHSENSDNPGVTVCDASSLSSQASTYTTNIRDDDAPSNARSRRAEFAGQRLPTANSEDSGRGTSLSSYATSSLEEETDRNSPDPRQGLEPARESRRDCQRVRGQARLHTPTPPPQAAGDAAPGNARAHYPEPVCLTCHKQEAKMVLNCNHLAVCKSCFESGKTHCPLCNKSSASTTYK